MNPSFKIETTDVITASANLYLEIGLQSIAYFVIDDNNKCIALHCFQFEGDGTADKMAGHLKLLAAEQNILQENFKKIVVIYSFPTALLVPTEYADDANRKQMLELVHGDVNDVFIRSDFVYRHGLQNVYTVPRQMDAVISYLFTAPVSTHQYSLLPDIHQTSGNALYCIFGSGGFTTMLSKDGRLQVIQTFQFNTPEDAAFYLLQLCEGFEVAAATVSIVLSGMIDHNSRLFAELNKYFLDMVFDALPENFTYPQAINDYPSHYFSHLFAAASCV